MEQQGNSVDATYDNIDKENLKQFHLLGYPIDIGIDLENGRILLNDNEISLKGFSDQKVNYRLIYYVNLKQVVGSNREPEKIYSLGMQYNNSDGKNEKIFANLGKNGMFIGWKK